MTKKKAPPITMDPPPALEADEETQGDQEQQQEAQAAAQAAQESSRDASALEIDHLDLRRSKSALNQTELVYDKLIRLRFQESDEVAQVCLEAAQNAVSALVVLRQNIDLLRVGMAR